MQKMMFGAAIAAFLVAAAIPASAVTMVSTSGTPLSETIKTNVGGNGTSIDFFSDPSHLKVVYSSTSTLSPSSSGGFAFVQGVSGAGFTNLTLTPDNFTFSDIKFNMQLPASTGGFEAPNGYKTDFTFDTTVYFTGGGSQLFTNDVGAGSGATFALVALLAPANKVGSVTGVVGAAGGLGGFVPPLVMGFLYGQFGSYAIGLLALAVVAVAALLFDSTTVRNAVNHRSAAVTR